MTMRLKIILKTFSALISSSLIIALLFIVSCDNSSSDDPKPELYDFSGIYTFKEASLQTEISITIGVVPITLPAGADITDEIAGGLLAEAACGDPKNGAIELKSNNELYFTCISESKEIKAGSWAYKDAEKILNLNLASPPLPAALPLKIQNVVIDEVNDIVSGSIISFPLTPDLMIGFLPASLTDGKTQEELDALKASFPAVLQIDLKIDFEKVP